MEFVSDASLRYCGGENESWRFVAFVLFFIFLTHNPSLSAPSLIPDSKKKECFRVKCAGRRSPDPMVSGIPNALTRCNMPEFTAPFNDRKLLQEGLVLHIQRGLSRSKHRREAEIELLWLNDVHALTRFAFLAAGISIFIELSSEVISHEFNFMKCVSFAQGFQYPLYDPSPGRQRELGPR